jgi:hypothetical protein
MIFGGRKKGEKTMSLYRTTMTPSILKKTGYTFTALKKTSIPEAMEIEPVEAGTLIPEPDRDFLAQCGYEYLIVQEGDNIHVVLKGVGFPPQYSAQQADVRIILPSGYPNAAVDVFRTSPVLALVNGNPPVGGTGRDNFDNKEWQVWSRHITWRIGVDNLRTFFRAIKKEIAKGI